MIDNNHHTEQRARDQIDGLLTAAGWQVAFLTRQFSYERNNNVAGRQEFL